MMQEVPKADVVVTNPTHFAVALRYDDKRMRAPIVVAKGADADRRAHPRSRGRTQRADLRGAAAGARPVPHVEIGARVPPALYVAVAQVLTYIYQLKRRASRAASQPPPPPVDSRRLDRH